MRRLRLRPALAGLLTALAACGTGSRERACDLVDGTGCPGDQQCVVRDDGTPACRVGNGDNRGDGQACDAEDQCAIGLGCVRVAGVARCARFCRSADRPDPCVDVGPGNGSADFPDFNITIRNDARCVAVLPARPDLGICVVPCRLGEPGDCPEGATCGVPRGYPAPTCVPAGSLPVLSACGASRGACAVGGVCAEVGGLSRLCLPPPDAEGACIDSLRPVPVVGASAEIDGEAPVACSPCVGLGVYGEAAYGHCLATTRTTAPLRLDICVLDENGQTTGPCACAPFGGPAVLADLSVRVARDLGRSVESRVGAGSAPPQVAASLGDAGWVWADGRLVDPALWAEGQPGVGDCAGLSSLGLVTLACDPLGPALCSTAE